MPVGRETIRISVIACCVAGDSRSQGSLLLALHVRESNRRDEKGEEKERVLSTFMHVQLVCNVGKRYRTRSSKARVQECEYAKAHGCAQGTSCNGIPTEIKRTKATYGVTDTHSDLTELSCNNMRYAVNAHDVTRNRGIKRSGLVSLL